MKFSHAARWIAYVLVLILPVFFFSTQGSSLELSKQTLFLFGSGMIWVCLLCDWLYRRRIEFFWHPLMYALCLPFLASVASAFVSSSGYLAWFGSSQELSLSVLSVGAITVFVLALPTIFSQPEHRVRAWIMGSSGLGLLLLSSFFGLSLAGSGILFGAVCVLILLLCASAFCLDDASAPLLHRGSLGAWEIFFGAMFMLVTLRILAQLSVVELWISVLIGALALLFVHLRLFKRSIYRHQVMIPLALCVIAFVGISGILSPFFSQRTNELSLGVRASTQVIFEEKSFLSSLFGTGAGTYPYAYAHWRPAELNITPFWRSSFSQAYSFFFTLPVVVGWVGFLCWLGLVSVVFLRVIKQPSVLTPIALTGGVLLFISPINFFLLAIVFVFFGAALGTHARRVHVGFGNHPVLAFCEPVCLVIVLMLLCASVMIGVARLVSSSALAAAVSLDQQGASPEQIETSLRTARTWNRFDDLPQRNEALLSLRLVNEHLGRSGDDLGVVKEQLLSGVLAAKRATAIDPNNGLNWLVQARVLRQYAGVEPKALGAALASLEKARMLEPSNPVYLTELGRTFVLLDNEASQAKAAEAFISATRLKSDYVPAHIELARLFEQQGRLDAAIEKMQSVVSYNPLDVEAKVALARLFLVRSNGEDVQAAQRVLLEAIELVPSYANARWLLASAYELAGSRGEALVQLEYVARHASEQPLVQERIERLLAGKLITSFTDVPQPFF